MRRHAPYRLGWRLVAALLFVIAPAGAAQAQDVAGNDFERAFDLPAQPLGAALAAFAKMTHFNVASESATVSRFRSAALRGRFTPQAALQRLLAGTGLAVTFTGPRLAIIYPIGRAPPVTKPSGHAAALIELDLAEVHATAPLRIGRPNPSIGIVYAQRAEKEIQDILDSDAAYHGKPLHVVIAVGTDANGRIRDARVARGSGESGRDRALPALLIGRQLTVAPPPGLVQPMWFDISVEALSRRDRQAQAR